MGTPPRGGGGFRSRAEHCDKKHRPSTTARIPCRKSVAFESNVNVVLPAVFHEIVTSHLLGRRVTRRTLPRGQRHALLVDRRRRAWILI